MRVSHSRGFTVVEVVIAVIVLTVGILALAGSATLAVRMIGSGEQGTRVGFTAAARIERLRQAAFSTTPPCSAAEWGSDSAGSNGITEHWNILAGAGAARRAMVVLRSRRPGGTSSDTVLLGVLCGAP